jgi:hypothetical protein
MSSKEVLVYAGDHGTHTVRFYRLGSIYLSAWGKPEGPILFNPFILGKKLGTLGNYLPIIVI